MAAFSNYLKNAILDHIFGGPAYTPPAAIYVAAYTVAPTSAGGGTEVSAGDYARIEVTNDINQWPLATGGHKSNNSVLTFPTATSFWGTIVSIGLLDAASGGNLLVFNTLGPDDTREIVINDVVRISIGGLTLTLT